MFRKLGIHSEVKHAIPTYLAVQQCYNKSVSKVINYV